MNFHTHLKLVATCAAFLLWLTTRAAPGALDLTPKPGQRKGNEGPPTSVLQFSNGKGRIDYQPPTGWRSSGGGHSVVFFTAEPTSWMRLRVVDKLTSGPKGSAPLTEEDLPVWAATFVPQGAEKVQLVKVVPSPFTLGPLASTELQYTCTLHGFRLSLSISVIDFSSTERLVIVVCAEPGNFEPIRDQAITSMFSWSPEEQ